MEKKNQDVKHKSIQNFKLELNLHQAPCPSTPTSPQVVQEVKNALCSVFLVYLYLNFELIFAAFLFTALAVAKKLYLLSWL